MESATAPHKQVTEVAMPTNDKSGNVKAAVFVDYAEDL